MDERNEPYRFTHDGATLIVEERPSTDGKPTVVLIHGLGMGRSVFEPLADVLQPHANVILIDLPGFGDAPEPPRTPTMERLGDTLAAFVDARHLSTPAVLVGHSMGTQVVLECAVRHPSSTRGIVLIAPTVDNGARRAFSQLSRLMIDLPRENPLVWLRGAREYLRAGPHITRKFRAILVHEPERSAPRLTVPALVLRGENDGVCPAEWVDSFADLIPRHRTGILRDHGHGSILSDPIPAASAIVRWLGEL